MLIYQIQKFCGITSLEEGSTSTANAWLKRMSKTRGFKVTAVTPLGSAIIITYQTNRKK